MTSWKIRHPVRTFLSRILVGRRVNLALVRVLRREVEQLRTRCTDAEDRATALSRENDVLKQSLEIAVRIISYSSLFCVDGGFFVLVSC